MKREDITTTVVLGTFGGGGSERAMINFANGLSSRGINVKLLVGRAQGPFRSIVNPEIDVFELGGGAMRSILKLRNWLSANPTDILFSSQTHVNVAAVLAARLLRKPNRPTVVIRDATTPSKDYAFTDSRLLKCFLKLSKYVFRYADHLIATSNDAASDCQQFYGLHKDRISYVYSPFVNEELFSQAKAPVTHPWFDETIPIVTSLGRVMPVKDFELLIQAFASARQQVPCRLMIIGDTERDPVYYAKLQQLVMQLGVAFDVEFVGFKTNPFPYLARSDTYVLSSRYEGLPGSLVQAMALGCKLVSANCQSGPREILRDGAKGKLVPVGDATAMASAIVASIHESHDRTLGPSWANEFCEEIAIDRLWLIFSQLHRTRTPSQSRKKRIA